MVRRTTRAKRAAVREGDQYLLRLPPGMRERLEQRAAENGRSMSAEVVEAIEKHLLAADRVTQLWELFGKHKENIEAIPVIWKAVAVIEGYLAVTEQGGDTQGHTPNTVSTRIRQREKKEHDAYVATLPLVTPEQVQIIKALLKERARGYDSLLRLMDVDRLEDMRGFERAMECLGEQWKKGGPIFFGMDSANETLPLVTPDQVQIIKALLKEIGVDEERFLALVQVSRLEDIRGFERVLKLLGQRVSNRTPPERR